MFFVLFFYHTGKQLELKSTTSGKLKRRRRFVIIWKLLYAICVCTFIITQPSLSLVLQQLLSLYFTAS